MGECETSEATSNSATGIVLTLLACVCYASGNCLQRYSLLRREGENVCFVLHKQLGWLLGAIIYFSANGIYAVALSFAPVSVLAAVFSLTIVVNATCAVFILGDKVPTAAYPGYIAVLAGSVLFSLTVKAEVCHFGAEELIDVMTSPTAWLYWTVLSVIIFGGMFFAWRFEGAYPPPALVAEDIDDEDDAVVTNGADGDINGDAVTSPTTAYRSQNDNNKPDVATEVSTSDSPVPDAMSLLYAGFLYPSSLGATEAVGALLLKAINSLLTTLATEEEDGEEGGAQADEEEEDPYWGLWIGLFTVGGFLFLSIVFWLRLVYRRFQITTAFPVEFGMLTFASVVGGFCVFEDHQYVDGTAAWAWVSIACLLILGGIGVVGVASWKEKNA